MSVVALEVGWLARRVNLYKQNCPKWTEFQHENGLIEIRTEKYTNESVLKQICYCFGEWIWARKLLNPDLDKYVSK